METRQEVHDRIIARAGKDDEFRAFLLEDPRAAVKNETGMAIPEQFGLSVHEEDSTTFHLVLPSRERLSEQDLARINAAANGAWGQSNY